MITYKAIAPNRRADGTHPVKIRVTFKGVSRKLPTSIVAYDKDLTRSGKIKNAEILRKAAIIIDQMRDVTSQLSPFTLEEVNIDWIVEYTRRKLTDEQFSLEFFEWAEKVMDTKNPTTRDSYGISVSSFSHFVGGSIDINDIDKAMINNYVADLVSRNVSLGTIHNYIRHLRHIHAMACRQYNDDDTGRILIKRKPFNIELDKAIHFGQTALPVEVIQMMIDDTSCKSITRFFLDIALMSFALMGANIADMWEARAKDVKNGVWSYERKKTRTRREDKARMQVYIQESIKPLFAKLRGNGDVWLFNPMHEYSTRNSFNECLNRALARWAADKGIEPFTLYAMRKSWATIGRRLGIEKATIDEGLAHRGDFALTDIYAQRDWDLINAANARILSLLKW